MTYRDLLNELAKLPPGKLEQQAAVCNRFGDVMKLDRLADKIVQHDGDYEDDQVFLLYD
jgi:hypothetical protein